MTDEFTDLSVRLARAVVTYSYALDEAQRCERGVSGFRTLQGDDLDALFDRMLSAANEVLATTGELKPGDPFLEVMKRTDDDHEASEGRKN